MTSKILKMLPEIIKLNKEQKWQELKDKCVEMKTIIVENRKLLELKCSKKTIIDLDYKITCLLGKSLHKLELEIQHDKEPNVIN